MGIKKVVVVQDKKRKGSIAKMKNTTVGSLFPQWELDLYPKALLEGIKRAEKRDYVRSELHRLQKNRIALTGKLARSKLTGYEQLKLLNLSEAPDITRDRKINPATVEKSDNFAASIVIKIINF